MKDVIFFPDSDSLRSYVREHNTYVWRGCCAFGSLEFIDSRGLYVVFLNRAAYENWDKVGRPCQFSLF
jgi:hypothetical protein